MEFRCRYLDRTMTMARCIRNQEDAEKWFGTEGPKKETCHLCADGRKRRDELMATIKKKCRNCGREMVIQQDGLCGACNGAAKRISAKKGTPEYEEALKDARERVLKNNLKPGGIERPVRSRRKPLLPVPDQETKQPERETIRAEKETEVTIDEKIKIINLPAYKPEAQIIPITLIIDVQLSVNGRQVAIG